MLTLLELSKVGLSVLGGGASSNLKGTRKSVANGEATQAG